MAIQYLAINKDYVFNLTNRARNKRISAEHGLVKCALEISYYYAEDFSKSWEYIKKAGWNVNYSETEIEEIYSDVYENSFFIDVDKTDFSKHVVAVL